MYWVPNLFVLVPITAIVLTFIVVMQIIKGFQDKAKYKLQAASKRELEDLEAQIGARDAVIDRLEERIRVLERIVTDKSSGLSDEIERLRA